MGESRRYYNCYCQPFKCAPNHVDLILAMIILERNLHNDFKPYILRVHGIIVQRSNVDNFIRFERA